MGQKPKIDLQVQDCKVKQRSRRAELLARILQDCRRGHRAYIEKFVVGRGAE